MNTINTTEKLFSIMDGVTPGEEGWTVIDSDGDLQIYSDWNRCKRPEAMTLIDVFNERLDYINDSNISASIECNLPADTDDKPNDRYWHVTVAIIVTGITFSQILTSAASLVSLGKKEKTPCQS